MVNLRSGLYGIVPFLIIQYGIFENNSNKNKTKKGKNLNEVGQIIHLDMSDAKNLKLSTTVSRFLMQNCNQHLLFFSPFYMYMITLIKTFSALSIILLSSTGLLDQFTIHYSITGHPPTLYITMVFMTSLQFQSLLFLL